MSQEISRRNFLGLCGALFGSSLIATLPGKAYGWGSFQFGSKSVIWDLLGFNDPIHEDVCQFAYSIVLQNHKDDLKKMGQGPKTILNPAYDSLETSKNSMNDYFLENFKYLRIGSYWNDASVNDLLEFIYTFLNKDDVSVWKPSGHQTYPYYEGIEDVSEHIGQSHQEKFKDYGYRTFTQFNSNDRAAFMHSMLSCNADGIKDSGHTTQGKSIRFTLSWLKEAYKYAIEGEPINESVRNLFDTYGQLDENKIDLDISGSFDNSAADVKLSSRQLRVKVLGMMCHTIEDSWCPAHAIRSYSNKNFGKIFAFGNYMKQNQSLFSNNHKYYDYYSDVDVNREGGDWREILINNMTPHQGAPKRIPVPEQKNKFLENTVNFDASQYGCKGGVKEVSKDFKTLALKYTIKYLSDFLELCYLGKKWEEDPFYYNQDKNYMNYPFSDSSKDGFDYYEGVGDWMERFMYKTELYQPEGEGKSSDNDEPWVCDAGRRALLVDYEIVPLISVLKEPIKKFFPEKGQLLIKKLNTLSNIYSDYIDTSIDFYLKYNFNGSDNCENVPGCAAADVERLCYNTFEDTFWGKDISLWSVVGDNKSFRESLSTDESLSWYRLITTISTLFQEFQYELISQEINYDITDIALRMIGDREAKDVIGTVESIAVHDDYYYFALRLNNLSIIYLYCEKDMISNKEDFIEGAKNIKVNISMPIDESSGSWTFYGVNSIDVPKLEDKSDVEYFIVGTVEDIYEGGFNLRVSDFSDNGSSVYSFNNDNNKIEVQKNQIYQLKYKIKDHKLIATKVSQNNNLYNESRYSSKITQMYGNCFEYVIKKEDIKELRKENQDYDITDKMFYMKTQISGMPVEDSNECDFIYGIDKELGLSKRKDLTITSGAPKPGYKFAIRIRNKNYNNDGSMDLYIPLGESKHIKTDKKLNSSNIEPCVFKDGYCIYCGAKEQGGGGDEPVPGGNFSSSASDLDYSTANTSDNMGAVAAAAAGLATAGAACLYKDNRKTQKMEKDK